MKNTVKYLLGTLTLAGTMVACSPEEFEGMSENGIANISSYESLINVSVDQSTNQVTLSMNGAQGVYPVWEIDLGKGKKDISTNTEYKRILTTMGDYTVRCYVGNRNGISSQYVEKTFHIDNSIVDFTKYTTMLSKAPWYIDNTVKGHLGCGEPGTEGTNWWSANPDEKAAFGVYDNALTFTTDMKYTFDPGAAGTLYANWGVTSNNWQATYWSGVENEDFNVPVELQTTTYGFDVDGDDLYLTFPKGTYFPYIANDDIWNTPRYLIVNMTTKQMTLRSDNGGIAWQYILTTQHEVKEVFNGFDVNSEDNVWKQANPTFKSLYYAHGGGWEGLPDYEHSEENGVFTLYLPTATDSQWQAQYAVDTELNSNNIIPGTSYDFSCKITATRDLPSVTLKLTSQTDDPSLINNQGGPLAVIPAMEETVVYFTEQVAPAIDGNYKFVFDFGGNPDDVQIEIKDIVVIDHSKNKISAPSGDGGNDNPGQPGHDAVMDWDCASPANLWSAVESGDAFISVTPWFSPSDWSGGLNPEWSHEGNVWSVTLPEGMGGDQWQGQFPINTTLTAQMGKKYNFYCVLEADNDCKGVTIKFTETDDAEKHDNNYFFADRHDVEAFTQFVYKAENVELPLNDAHALSLFFDFGGSPIGTTIKISDIYFEEAVSVDYDSENNLWKAVDGGDAFLSVTPWFSPSDWSGGLNPEWSHEGNVWSVTLPEGMGGDQWQGQFPINTTLTASMADTYNFSCTLEADNDCKGVTIKLTETDDAEKHDDNYFFADRHDVEAYEPFVYTVKNVKLPKNDAHALSLFFDFGGSPVGTNVKISNITLIKN